MTYQSKSCSVAVPMQRNYATPENSATGNATQSGITARKPASILELRMQLQAQQHRNQCSTVPATNQAGVALESEPNQESCTVALPSECNTATALIKDLMEVDGLTREQAQELAKDCIAVKSPGEWLSLIAELDGLITRYCALYRLSDEAQERILNVRNKQSLASIPHTLAWFRIELGEGKPAQGP